MRVVVQRHGDAGVSHGMGSDIWKRLIGVVMFVILLGQTFGYAFVVGRRFGKAVLGEGQKVAITI